MRSDWFIETLELWESHKLLSKKQAIHCLRLIKSASISAGGRVLSNPDSRDLAAKREYAIFRANASLNRYARLKHRRENFLQLLDLIQNSEELIEHLEAAVTFARCRAPGVDEYARDTPHDDFLLWKSIQKAGNLLLRECHHASSVTLLSDGYYVEQMIAHFAKAKKEIVIAVGIVVWDGSEGHPVAPLISEIERAIKRGVRVEVYNNLESTLVSDTKLGRQMKFTLSHILSLGGHLTPVNKMRSFHSKLVIIDQQKIVIGSHNWSGNSFANFADLSVICESPDLTKAFFRSLLQGAG